MNIVAEGTRVRANWSWNGRNMSGLGTIYRVRPEHVIFELEEEVRQWNPDDKIEDVWTPGCRFSLPLPGTSTWSENNCYEIVSTTC